MRVKRMDASNHMVIMGGNSKWLAQSHLFWSFLLPVQEKCTQLTGGKPWQIEPPISSPADQASWGRGLFLWVEFPPRTTLRGLYQGPLLQIKKKPHFENQTNINTNNFLSCSILTISPCNHSEHGVLFPGGWREFLPWDWFSFSAGMTCVCLFPPVVLAHLRVIRSFSSSWQRWPERSLKKCSWGCISGWPQRGGTQWQEENSHPSHFHHHYHCCYHCCRYPPLRSLCMG